MSSLKKGKAVRETALGIAVKKTAISLADIDLFTVKGEVMITLLYGVVTGVGDGGATTILLNEKTDSIALCAATTVTSDAVDEVYVLTGDRLLIMGGTGAVPVKHVAGTLAAFPHGPIIYDGGTTSTIELTQTGDDATHAVEWTLVYVPLEEGASVVAA